MHIFRNILALKSPNKQQPRYIRVFENCQWTQQQRPLQSRRLPNLGKYCSQAPCSQCLEENTRNETQFTWWTELWLQFADRTRHEIVHSTSFAVLTTLACAKAIRKWRQKPNRAFRLEILRHYSKQLNLATAAFMPRTELSRKAVRKGARRDQKTQNVGADVSCFLVPSPSASLKWQ